MVVDKLFPFELKFRHDDTVMLTVCTSSPNPAAQPHSTGKVLLLLRTNLPRSGEHPNLLVDCE